MSRRWGHMQRWKQVREALVSRSDALGYEASIVVLNASAFGVPQSRERMFLVGLNRKAWNLNRVNLRAALIAELDRYREKPASVADVVRKFGRAGSPGNPRACSAVVTYAKSPVLRPSPYAGMLFNGAGRPLRSSGVSSTLPASMGGNKTPIVDEAEIFEGAASFVEEYHQSLRRGEAPRTGTVPKRLRRLTVDECLAIQSFPMSYQLLGSQSSQYRQIGNAVPPRLARAIALVGARFLEGGDSAVRSAERASKLWLTETPLLFEGSA
ncbi:MAG: DNA cytosine methyltransferase [Verrucomicrobiales bacterium]